MSSVGTGPIVEYSHDLLNASGRWASQWKEGDEHICWYDGHPFNWFPVPIPTSYDESKKTYRVFGTFCCFQCAKAWQINNPSFNTPISRSWLAIMAKELFGYKHAVICPAPEQWVLLSKKISISEFREQCKDNVPVETVHPASFAGVHGEHLWQNIGCSGFYLHDKKQRNCGPQAREDGNFWWANVSV